MLFLRLGKNLPIYAEILLVALYLILVFLIFRSLWRRYQKHVPEEKKKFKLSGKDIGFAFLFFFLARAAAIVGVYLNLILSGNSQTINRLSSSQYISRVVFAESFVTSVGLPLASYV